MASDDDDDDDDDDKGPTKYRTGCTVHTGHKSKP